jgi:hypothetical protein
MVRDGVGGDRMKTAVVTITYQLGITAPDEATDAQVAATVMDHINHGRHSPDSVVVEWSNEVERMD